MHPGLSNLSGHLMGKKSIESLQETGNSDYLMPSASAGVTVMERYDGLMGALMQPKNQKQKMPQTADRLLRLRSGWREEDRDKYLREVS